MSDFCYNMNGYPEPEHIFLGKTPFLAFTLFPKHQDSHKPQPHEEYDASDCFYNPDEPLYYDIEFRAPFKEDANGKVVTCPIDINIDDWYLAKRVDLETARKLCAEFLDSWCKEKGLTVL